MTGIIAFWLGFFMDRVQLKITGFRLTKDPLKWLFVMIPWFTIITISMIYLEQIK